MTAIIPAGHRDIDAALRTALKRSDIDDRLRQAIESAVEQRGLAAANVPFDARRRGAFVEMIAAGATPREAATQVGVPWLVAYQARESDAKFAQAWAIAHERSVEAVESRMLRAAADGDESLTMSEVRAGETVLKGRSGRYRQQGPGRAEAKVDRASGVISVSVGLPGVD